MSEVDVDIDDSGGSIDGIETAKGKPWWTALAKKKLKDERENKECADLLCRRVRLLGQENSAHMNVLKTYEKLYNLDYKAMQSMTGANAIICNLGRIGVNAIHSMIGKEMPSIVFMTNRSRYPLRRTVGLLNDYIQSEFEHSLLYRNVRAAVRDAACSNIGTCLLYTSPSPRD